MAEILGAASAVVGLAAFATQVVEKIDALNATYKYNRTEAATSIESLTSQLEFLRFILQSVQFREGHPAVDQAIVKCQMIYNSIDPALEELLERVSYKPSGKRNGLKLARMLFSRDIRRKVQTIESKLDTINKTLSLSLLFYSVQPLMATLRSSPGESTAASALNQSTFGDSYFPNELHPQDQSSEILVKKRASQTQQTSCRRYWGFEYTPFSTFFARCDNMACTTRTPAWKLRFALNRLRIPCALVIGLKIVSGTGKCTIQPALSLERTVNYTSPGFEILWKCQNRIITLSEAQRSFYELYKSDNGLKNHVNPDGNGYVQELLNHGPWGLQDIQSSLLRFSVREFGMTLDNKDQSFLIKCAAWIGEGRHLDLLAVILESGFDPTNIASPLFQRWPPPSSPNWISEEKTPDPFFIEYLAILAKAGPGFAGFTMLHDAILLQSVESVRQLSSSLNKLEEDRNFLGQTPLHLASVNMEISRILLDAGHDIDTTDKYGMTPLIYAAGMGNSQVVQMLILRGADTTKSDTRWNRDFISYACTRGHWGLIFESLNTIRTCYTGRSYYYFVNDAILALIADNVWIDGLRRATYFEKLVNLCGDVNFTFKDGQTGTLHNNLLHYVRHRNEAQALVRCGFRGFNQPNSDGKLAIYSMTQSPDTKLIKYCIEKGTNVDHIDLEGRTVLFHLISQLGDFNWLIWDTIDSIQLCLARGADIFLPDNCDCPCVIYSNGCHTSSAFGLGFYSKVFGGPPDLVWAFEWLSIVEEFRGHEASKKMLLSFLRRTQTDMVDITHVCCHRGKGVAARDYGIYKPKRIPHEEVMEILDEEDEFHKILEEDMQPWMNQSSKVLRSQWMVLLKRTHDNTARAREEDRGRGQVNQLTRGVDYKNDRFIDSITSVSPDSRSTIDLARSMAEYAFWLQHEYFRSGTRLSNIAKESWRERRMSWFRELMDVMQLQGSEIIKDMLEITITESRSEQVDRKMIIEQFSACLNSTVSETVDITP